MLLEILRDSLRLEVVEALLEDANPLDDGASVGGAVRLAPIETARVGGFAARRVDADAASVVVECFADEAIGLALAANAPIACETALWGAASRACRVDLALGSSTKSARLTAEVGVSAASIESHSTLGVGEWVVDGWTLALECVRFLVCAAGTLCDTSTSRVFRNRSEPNRILET